MLHPNLIKSIFDESTKVMDVDAAHWEFSSFSYNYFLLLFHVGEFVFPWKMMMIPRSKVRLELYKWVRSCEQSRVSAKKDSMMEWFLLI